MRKYESYFGNHYRIDKLNEAVIIHNEYLKKIKKKILGNTFKKIVLKSEYLQEISRMLTSFFSWNHIDFDFENKIVNSKDRIVPFGFNDAGVISDKYNTIYIVLNPNILKIKEEMYTDFVKIFIYLLKHELIHRAQKLHLKSTEEKQKVYDTRRDASDTVYFSNKYEIMARAFTIVEECRLFGNMTDEEIIDLSKLSKKYTDYQLVNISYSLWKYRGMFNKNSDTMKLLYKYIVEYVEKSIREL